MSARRPYRRMVGVADWPVALARDPAALAAIESRLKAQGLTRGDNPSAVCYVVDPLGSGYVVTFGRPAPRLAEVTR